MEQRRRAQRIGLPAGPILALLAYSLLPDVYASSDGELLPFSHPGRATAAVAVWMATWWLTEAIAVYATALLPLVLFPLLGARNIHDTASPYAHELIFLFMGGFLLALAMERWGLHRRVALVALRLVGDRPRNMVAGFMGVTAVLSMWVSNTATAIMMLPVALSVIELVKRRPASPEAGPETGPEAGPKAGLEASSDCETETPEIRNFALALLLGIAYAASIGGTATPIGTPPNLFLVSYAHKELGIEISFVGWMAFALPFVALFLPAAWWLLTRLLFPCRLERIEGGAQLVQDALEELGPMQRPERIVAAVFALASVSWITRPLLSGIELGGVTPLAGLSDAGIAMLAAMLLFAWPAGEGRGFVLEWSTARELPWGILVLFGGGLSLAGAIRANGVGELLTAQVTSFAGLSPLFLLLAVVVLIVFLTELTSNTATTATLVPILAALAPGLGLSPLELIVPAALAASCAFMLPVATPPNAIVFGSGLVPIAQMSRAGFWLNWLGVALITLFAHAFVMRMLG